MFYIRVFPDKRKAERQWRMLYEKLKEFSSVFFFCEEWNIATCALNPWEKKFCKRVSFFGGKFEF